MAKLDLQQQPHRRFNPLTREWILVSPHRTQRPWQGQTEATSTVSEVQYDPQCYMCPGNLRASGERTPKYENVFVFNNDYPSLLRDTPQVDYKQGELLVARGEPGICRVMCFSPRHDLTIARMAKRELELVVDAWTEEYQKLSANPLINYVQIFENRGAMMGASNPHPSFFQYLSEQLAFRLAQARDLALAQSHCLELSGSLSNFDLVTIYQTIVNSSQTGELRISNEKSDLISALFFEKGQPRCGQFEHLTGEEALWQLFLSGLPGRLRL